MCFPNAQLLVAKRLFLRQRRGYFRGRFSEQARPAFITVDIGRFSVCATLSQLFPSAGVRPAVTQHWLRGPRWPAKLAPFFAATDNLSSHPNRNGDKTRQAPKGNRPAEWDGRYGP